jgi:hemerythrin
MVSGSLRPLIGRQHLLGHDAIDTDHLAIADWWSRTVGCAPIEFESFTARLKKLMRQHFDHEAMLTAEAGGRICECHSHEHQTMLALYDRASTVSRCHWRRARTLQRWELPKLFRQHIISRRIKTVLFLFSQNKWPGRDDRNVLGLSKLLARDRGPVSSVPSSREPN